MKVEKLTIAHISDTHRSDDNPISNTALLDSLIHDLDTYTSKGVPQPDLLIVSGDIVQGGTTTNQLKNQYSEALEFFTKLATLLFNGDKSRIIVVPGNHDISWEESKKSMVQIEEQELVDKNGVLRKNILEQAFKINTEIKWSWSDRSFYKIYDRGIYNNRLSSFSGFYQDFYDGKRSYNLDPDEQYEIFDYPELGITIVGFNSCFHNDHLNRAGSINPECIANIGLNLRKYEKDGRLILAVWHHNTKGGPYDQDYMDNSFIQNLISYGVKIGFHGHQHKHEILREENNIIEGKMMLVLSAGSLCAGPAELPAGHNQQYNILELSRINDGQLKFRLWSRVKTPESSFDNPIWEDGTFTPTTTEFVTELDHSLPSIPTIGKAEQLLGDKNYSAAKEILTQHDINDPLVRRLLLECYEKLENYSAIVEHFSNPQNSVECISLLNASIEIGNHEVSKQILDVVMIKQSTDPSVVHLRKQLIGKVQ